MRNITGIYESCVKRCVNSMLVSWPYFLICWFLCFHHPFYWFIVVYMLEINQINTCFFIHSEFRGPAEPSSSCHSGKQAVTGSLQCKDPHFIEFQPLSWVRWATLENTVTSSLKLYQLNWEIYLSPLQETVGMMVNRHGTFFGLHSEAHDACSTSASPATHLENDTGLLHSRLPPQKNS